VAVYFQWYVVFIISVVRRQALLSWVVTRYIFVSPTLSTCGNAVNTTGSSVRSTVREALSVPSSVARLASPSGKYRSLLHWLPTPCKLTFIFRTSWRWAFYFQLPIAGLAMVATFFFLPSIGVRKRELMWEKVKSVDYFGIITLVGGCILVLVSQMSSSVSMSPISILDSWMGS
jgi:hypothetical protein